MFCSLRKSLAVLFVGAVGVVASGSSAEATVLQFEMTPYPGDTIVAYEGPFASYGDNVTATNMPGPGGRTYHYGMGNAFTPNITVDYTSSPGPNSDHSAFGAQNGWSDPVDYLRYADGSTYWFTFTPTGGHGVDINSFAIDLYAGVGQIDWNLRQDTTTGTIFASGTETGLTQAGPDRIVNIANGAYYGTTILEVTISGTNTGGNIGLDDLNFDQLVLPAPEPTTGWLLALGGLGLAAMRKRKSCRRPLA
jgi:hypothetical protein